MRSITELARARIRGPDRKLVDSGNGAPTVRGPPPGVGPPREVGRGGAAASVGAGGDGPAPGAGTGLRWREGPTCAGSGPGGKCSAKESRLYMVAPRKA